MLRKAHVNIIQRHNAGASCIALCSMLLSSLEQLGITCAIHKRRQQQTVAAAPVLRSKTASIHGILAHLGMRLPSEGAGLSAFVSRDFESFKEVMLEYKREATQGGLGLQVTCHAMKVSEVLTGDLSHFLLLYSCSISTLSKQSKQMAAVLTQLRATKLLAGALWPVGTLFCQLELFSVRLCVDCCVPVSYHWHNMLLIERCGNKPMLSHTAATVLLLLLLQICTEEQEDGEERPDLDLGLQISPVGPGPRAMKA